MNRILFYRLSDSYGEFSNFSPHPLQLKCKVWPTAEHYFQAQKFADTDHEDAIRRAKSPMMAARMGRSRERPLRSVAGVDQGKGGEGAVEERPVSA